MENDPTNLSTADMDDADALRAADLKRQSDLNAFLSVLNSRDGRTFIWNLLGSTGVFRATDVSSDIAMAVREGERNVGLRVMADIAAHAPDLYITMLLESQEHA